MKWVKYYLIEYDKFAQSEISDDTAERWALLPQRQRPCISNEPFDGVQKIEMCKGGLSASDIEKLLER